jgi:carbamoyl-phosphate synthase small subunit
MTDANPTAAVAGHALAPTGVLVLADGSVFWGQGLGAGGASVGEVCFNTAMTGYQEILTDPSYAGQIVCFTFPHVGNVGTNDEDIETATPAVRGLIVKADVTTPSNYRNAQALTDWAKRRNIVGLSGIDTRALTRRIREQGMPNGVIAHAPDGKFDLDALKAKARSWPGLEGMDLAKEVTTRQTHEWREGPWIWDKGFSKPAQTSRKIVALDYGIKRNILRSLAGSFGPITVLGCEASADEVLSHNPAGVVLSNGPGDPAATGVYAVPTIRKLIDKGVPIFGICLGHQMLALALGAKTKKMHQGHHGANHPVKDLTTGKVEIVSMNHGFTVDAATFPKGVVETHVSLFDGTNCGLAVEGKPIFSVQYHPEASPGPHDSAYLFERFAGMVK